MNARWAPPLLSLAGVVLLALAISAGAAPRSGSGGGKSGGTFRAEFGIDTFSLDPALNYIDTGWDLEYSTACKLLNYPDRNGPAGAKLQPEVATRFPRISHDGRTYTFVVRRGFRFANGEAVTATSFAAAFNRDADPRLASPASAFLSDIVGARAKLEKRASTITGISVAGNSISFTLERPAPDFLARVAMPFFQAVPLSFATKLNRNGENVIPSCGPYWVSARRSGESVTLTRNPYYVGKRPANFDEIDVKIGNSNDVIEQDILSGTTDLNYGDLPPNDWKRLAGRYGVNRGRIFFEPSISIAYLALNHDRPLFRNNPQLAKAINYAIDRRAIGNQSGYGSGTSSDHILPPGMPGSRACRCYPLTGSDLATARKLAAGHTGNDRAVLWVSSRNPHPLIGLLLQYELARIGLKVDLQVMALPTLYSRAGVRGADFDIVEAGWVADYPDPYDFINVLLDGGSIKTADNVNIAYYNVPAYNEQMRAAQRLFGAERYATYGSLDVDMMRNDPPWVVLGNGNYRSFVSSRVGCFTYGPNLVDYGALCLK